MKWIQANIKVLGDDEIEQIHAQSLRILSGIGLRVPHARVRSLLAAAGADAEEDSEIVRIPEAALAPVLEQARRGAHTFARTDDRVRCVTGNVSTQVFRFDPRTGARRLGTAQDVREGIALIEGLPNIPRTNAVVVPSDVPLPDLASFRLIYQYAHKDGGTYVLSAHTARYVIEMARCMGRTPSYLLDTVSPLQFTQESLEIACLFAQAGLPLTMTPLVMAGSTGPVTLAGALTLQNAEALALLFTIWVLTGQIAQYVASGHSSDVMQTMMCSFGSPNQALFGIGAAQMAAFYGLTAGANTGMTDALFPNFQGGFEKGMTGMTSILAGCRDIGGQGIAGADQGFSMEQLVLDDCWLDAVNYVLRGIEVSEETIGLETLREVGIGGNFLGEEHTVMHMRDSWWRSTLFGCNPFTDPVAQDDLLERAAARAQQLIAQNHTGEPVISPSQADTLDRLYAEAVRTRPEPV